MLRLSFLCRRRCTQPDASSHVKTPSSPAPERLQKLYDMVLVKDNHLAALGGLSSFADRIRRLREERPSIRIEVEADDLEQVRAFVEIEGIDVILLDNMTPAQIREAVALRKDNIQFEASGGITLRNVSRIAATGVDY